jgi:N-acetylglucosamine-6-sulfatase
MSGKGAAQPVFVATLVMIAVAASIAVAPSAQAQVGLQRPDVILIVTDDQSLDTMAYMPFTRTFFRTRYSRAYVSNPVCCPSRTSILTGTYSSTNKVWTNEGTFGGWLQFSANGWETNSIPTLLQQNGYRTGMFGKFLNGWDDRIPLGWDEMAAFATLGVRGPRSPYYNYSLRHVDGTYEDHLESRGDYSTDVVTRRAVAFINEAGRSRPQFLYFSVLAPHGVTGNQPPIPAPRHLRAPVAPEPAFSPNFLESNILDKPAYIGPAQRRSPTSPDFYRNWLTQAARSLYAVDEGIEAIVDAQRIRDPGLRDTIFLFISDNGLLTGAHGLLGKGVPYEEAIRVPLMARYPGVAKGIVRDIVLNVDIAPTIVEAAGIASVPWTIEGESLLEPTHRQWAFIQGAPRGHPYCGVASPTRKIVRYASGEWEFYDLRKDPYELVSRPASSMAVALQATATAACEGKLPPLWPRPSL